MADQWACFLAAIREQESGGNYRSVNRSSGASGAYQFMPGTWRYALGLAGYGTSPYAYRPAADAPPWLQDAAAKALMSRYYNQFGHSFYNVAEAWYGGPGAVGHPGWGGGPGYPNVGQYAAQVMAKMSRCLGGAPLPPPPATGDPGQTTEWRDFTAAWGWVQNYTAHEVPAATDWATRAGYW